MVGYCPCIERYKYLGNLSSFSVQSSDPSAAMTTYFLIQCILFIGENWQRIMVVEMRRQAKTEHQVESLAAVNISYTLRAFVGENSLTAPRKT